MIGQVLDSDGRAVPERASRSGSAAIRPLHHPRDGGGAGARRSGLRRDALPTGKDLTGSAPFGPSLSGPGHRTSTSLSGLGFDRFTTQMYVAGEPLNR